MFYSRDFPELSDRQIPNRVARVHNTLVSAMSRRATLPKIIVFILEDDIIDYIDYNDYGVSEMMGPVMEYMTNEIRVSINKFKHKYLPKKSFRQHWPKIIWLMPTLHNNYSNNNLRRKLQTELYGILRKNNDNDTMGVKLKQWSSETTALVQPGTRNLTQLGLRCYWEAVDQAIKFADFRLFSDNRCKTNNHFTTKSS